MNDDIRQVLIQKVATTKLELRQSLKEQIEYNTRITASYEEQIKILQDIFKDDPYLQTATKTYRRLVEEMLESMTCIQSNVQSTANLLNEVWESEKDIKESEDD